MILLVSVQLTKAQRRFTEVFDVEVTHQEQDLSDALLDDLLNSDIAHRPTIRDLVTQRDKFLHTSDD